MKKIVLTTLYIFSALFLQAQNYRPLHAVSYKYSPHTASEWMGNISEIYPKFDHKDGSDSIFILQYNSQIYTTLTGGCLGDYMIKKSAHEYEFGWDLYSHKVVFQTNYVQGQSWVFCPEISGGNLTATFHDKIQEAVLGVLDSVIVIKLSNDEIIKISKQFGLVKVAPLSFYIDSPEQWGYIELQAIPFFNLGHDYLDPLKIYDFQIGDVRVYKTHHLYPNYEKKYGVSIEVINKTTTTNQDTIDYTLEVTTNENGPENTATSEYHLFVSRDHVWTTPDTLFPEHFGNAYNGKRAHPFYNFKEHRFAVYSGNGYITEYGYTRWLSDYEGTSYPTEMIEIFSFPRSEHGIMSMYYQHELGLIKYKSTSAYPYDDLAIYEWELICDYNISDPTVDCSTDIAGLYLLSVENSEKQTGFLSLQPNPADDKISLSLSSEENRNAFITIVAADGRTMYKNVYSSTIDISSLPSGIYQMNVTSDDTTQSIRFVVY